MLVNKEGGIECVGTRSVSVSEQRVGDRMCRDRECKGTRSVSVRGQRVLVNREC